MLRALGDISISCSDPAYRRKLLEIGTRIVEGCAEKLGDEEVRPMRVRLAGLENLTTDVSHPAGELSG